MKLYVSANGNCSVIYDEALDLRSLGRFEIKRASHVEPTKDGRWTADLSPVAGPILGPFIARSQALAAELAWLNEHFLKHGETQK